VPAARGAASRHSDLSAPAGATSAQQRPHLLTAIPSPLPGVTAYPLFLKKSHAQQIHSGDEVSVLLTLHNEAAHPINVTAIAGSINSPEAMRLHIQNFTVSAPNAAVAAGADRSFLYQFTPNKCARAGAGAGGPRRAGGREASVRPWKQRGVSATRESTQRRAWMR